MPEVVVDFGAPPQRPFHLPHFSLGSRTSKLITAGAAVVISLSLITFTIFSVATNNSDFKKKHGITTAVDEAQATTTSDKSAAALPGGGVTTGIGSTSGTNAPVVTLSAQPGTLTVGGKTHLKWTTTNNPKMCTASDDWAGNKPTSGEEDTPALTKVQTYYFTLTCKTDTGTGYSYLSINVTAITNGSTTSSSNPTSVPHTTIAASQAITYVGLSTTLTWDTTNNPTSCTASGDWSGIKPGKGSEATQVFTSAKVYTFYLSCKNSVGTEAPIQSAQVKAIDPPPDVPLVTITGTPVSPVTPGTKINISWEASNSPTSCTASGDWAGTKGATGTYTTASLTTIKSYSYTLSCSNSSGGTSSTLDVTVVPNQPVVTLTVSPSTTTVNTPVTISWTATNSPTSCTASGDWSGAITPTSGGTRSFTPTQAKSYIFNLNCTNAGGTGGQNNVILTANNPPAPSVTISATPISITAGGSANVTWNATNSPTSCTASGTGWSGTKTASGTQSTGIINAPGTYTYSLSCSNAGGTGSASTSVTVSSGGVSSPPVVTVNLSPTSIGTGSSATVSWSATNSPTNCTASGTAGTWVSNPAASGSVSTGTKSSAGTFTYTMTCSNSAGSGNATATLTVVAVPNVTISVNPTTLTAGASATATVSWSATNSPTSCTAGGSWSGSKSTTPGSATVGPITTAGTYVYSLTCSNAGGTGPTASATLTATAPVAVYCSGNTPCYGPNDLKQHVTQTDCWGYNLNKVVNVTSLNNGYHKSRANLFPSGYTGVCGNVNLAPFISGSSSIPGIGSHNHTSSTKNNTGTIASYLVNGFYDATKP